MKKSLILAALAISALMRPDVASAAVNSELNDKAMVVGDAVTTVTEGWYLLYNVNRNNYVKEETTAFKMRAIANLSSLSGYVYASEYAGFLFKITPSTTDGEYNIVSGNGIYFALGNDNSSVSESARNFTITNYSGNKFYIKDVVSGYIADGQQNDYNFVGYGQNAPTNTNGNNMYNLRPVSLAEFIDVTYNYSNPFDNTTISFNKKVAPGADASNVSVNGLFTKTGLQETNTIVSNDNKTFTIQGTWSLPFALNTVYRVRLKPSESASRNIKYDAASNYVLANNGTGNEVEKERFWYFKANGADNQGNPQVTMHTLANDEGGAGITIQFSDNSKATISNNPTAFSIVPTTVNGHQDNDLCLMYNNCTGAINYRDHYFSTWNNADQATYSTDGGSLIRLFALTEDDFGYFEEMLSDEDVASAKTNPTPEAINGLFTAIAALPADRELYATQTQAIAANYKSSVLANLQAYAENGVDVAKAITEITNYNIVIPELSADVTTLPATLEAINAFEESVTIPYEALSQEAREAIANSLVGRHFQIRSRVKMGQHNLPWLTVVNEGDGTNLHNNISDRPVMSIWELVDADNEGKVYLRNAFSGKYVKLNETANQNNPLVTLDEGPSAFTLRYDINGNGFGFDTGNSLAGGSDHGAIHATVHNGSTGLTVKWHFREGSDNSWFDLVSVDGEVDVKTSKGDNAGDIVIDFGNATPTAYASYASGVEKLIVKTVSLAQTEDETETIQTFAASQSPDVTIDAANIENGTVILSGMKPGVYDVYAPAGFFTVNNKLCTPVSARFTVNSDGTSTGIGEVTVAAPANKVIYDLQGRRVAKAVKGIYIINGVKTLVK